MVKREGGSPLFFSRSLSFLFERETSIFPTFKNSNFPHDEPLLRGVIPILSLSIIGDYMPSSINMNKIPRARIRTAFMLIRRLTLQAALPATTVPQLFSPRASVTIKIV